MDPLEWRGIHHHIYVVLTLLLWILLLRSTRCHDHGVDTGEAVADKYMYFTYASVARSVATVTEPDNSTVQYHVWRAGRRRNCVINISSSVLDDVVKVKQTIVQNHWRIQVDNTDGRPPHGPNSFIFMQLSAKISQNNWLVHLCWELQMQMFKS